MLVSLNGAPLTSLQATQVVKQIGSTANSDRTLIVRRSSTGAQSAGPQLVEVSLPRGRLRVTFEDGPEGVFIDTVNDASPAKGMVSFAAARLSRFGPTHVVRLWCVQVLPGDVLMQLNGSPLTNLDATQIVKAIGSLANAERNLVVRRP